MEKENFVSFDSFSKHLFWDVNIEDLDFVNNKKYVIHRVLEYGLMEDWRLLNKIYGIDEIGKIAITLKNLDNKTLSFVSLLTKIPKENFSCYTTLQSHPKHWNF